MRQQNRGLRVALLALGLFIVGSCQAGESPFQDGTEYVYSTEVKFDSRTMDYAPHAAAGMIKMKVRIQAAEGGKRLNIQLEDSKMSHFVGSLESEDMDKLVYLPQGASSFKFSALYGDDGLFKSLMMDSGMPFFLKNAVRSWAAKFQMHCDKIHGTESTAFIAEEETIHGKCRVTYAVSPHMIHKSIVHNSDCTNRKLRVFDDMGGFFCTKDYMPPPTDGFNSREFTWYRLKHDGNGKVAISEIRHHEAFILQQYESEGVSHLIHTNVSMVLQETKASAGDISASGETLDSLGFDFGDQDYMWDKNRDLKAQEPFFSTPTYYDNSQDDYKAAIKKGLANVKDMMGSFETDKASIMKMHLTGLTSLYPAMNGMDYGSIISLVDEFRDDKSEEGVFRFNVFTELLASTGTAPSIMAVKTMIKDNLFDNDRDAVRVLGAIGFHVRKPNQQMVVEIEELIKTLTDHSIMKETALLVLGLVIRRTCEQAGLPYTPERKACLDVVAKDRVKKFASYVTDPSTLRRDRVMYLGVLNNIRFGGVFENLRGFIKGSKDHTDPDGVEIRAKALWTASAEMLAAGQGRDMLLGLVADCHESHEVRSSALALLVRARPSPADMAQVASVLSSDKSYHLINFAFTLLETVANSVQPCGRETQELAENFLKYLKQFSGGFEASYGFGMSKYYSREFYKEKYGYAMSYDYYVVGSDRSTTPLLFGMSGSTTLFHSYRSITMAVHVRVEGLAKLLVRKFKSSDPVTWKMSDLKGILSGEMGIRENPDQPVKVSIEIQVKGVVVFVRSYEEKDFLELMSSGSGSFLEQELKKMTTLKDSAAVNHQRLLQGSSFKVEFPTAAGIPGAAMVSDAFLFSLKADMKRGNQRGFIFRDIEYDAHLFRQRSQGMMLRLLKTKATLGVAQDIVSLYHLPRHVVIGANILKKEIKLQMDRPAHDHPYFVMMHSFNYVTMRGNSLSGEVGSILRDSCPTCSKTDRLVVVSRGSEFVRNRHFIQQDSEKGGYHLHGEYFDCENKIAPFNTVSHALAAFMPYNKNPKSPANMVFMGLQQIAAYFHYYPRAEQCGLKLDFSQSENNGVKEIETVIKVSMEDNGERYMYSGRKWNVKALMKQKGDETRSYKMSMTYEGTPGRLDNKLKLQLGRSEVATLQIKPYTICLAYENRYPDFQPEMMGFNPQSPQKMTGRAMLQYGEGNNCGDGDGEIKVKFEYTTSPVSRSQWFYRECMKDKSLPAYAAMAPEKVPPTHACLNLLYDSSLARRYHYEVEFIKVTDRMKEIISRFRAAIKSGLYPYFDTDFDSTGSDGNGIGPFLNLDLFWHDEDKLLDVTIETSQGKKTISNHVNRLDWTDKLRNLRMSKTYKTLYEMGVLSSCLSNVDSISTLDNFTYPYTAGSCWTLISGHCSNNPTYAVFTKKSDGNKPLDLKAYIGGHEVMVNANTGEAKVNGQTISIPFEKSYAHTVNDVEIFKIFKWGSTYNINSSMRVWISFDGTYAQVIPAPSVRGEHCGMCGNYNRIPWDEMVGKDGKKLADATKMAAEWQWKC